MLGFRIAKLVIAAALPVLALFAPAAHAQVPVDVSNNQVTCNTIVKGSLKVSPAFVNGGTSPSKIKVKGVLAGCSSDSSVSIIDFKSKFSGTIELPTNDCAGLLVPAVTSAELTVKWKTDPKSTPTSSVITIGAGDVTGGLLVTDWGAGYAYLGLGVNSRPSGMPGTALSVTGAFTGGDGGALSTADLVSQEDAVQIFNACAGAGVKALNLGIGQLHLQ